MNSTVYLVLIDRDYSNYWPIAVANSLEEAKEQLASVKARGWYHDGRERITSRHWSGDFTICKLNLVNGISESLEWITA